MTNQDLRTLTKYCSSDECGDPVSGIGARRTKRQLQFAGVVWWMYAKYRCPVCEDVYYFRKSFLGSHYVSVAHSTYRREIRIGATIVAAVLLLAAAIKIVDNYKAGKRRQEQEDVSKLAQMSTKEFIDLKAERAEIYNETQVRVLVAAKIRDGADLKKALFLHAVGYLLDQNGTRYDPVAASLDNPSDEIDTDVPAVIVVGETYRYYLLAPIHADPYSHAPPSKRIKRLTLYLPNSAPQELAFAPQSP